MKIVFKNLFFNFKSSKVKILLSCFLSSSYIYYNNSRPKTEVLPSSLPKKYYPKLSENDLQQFLLKYPLVTAFNNNKSIEYLMSHLRYKNLGCFDFRYYANRIIRLLLESAIVGQELKTVTKESPLGEYEALETEISLNNFCAVTILRAGNSFLEELMHLFPGIPLGQVLVQRNEESKEKEPIFYFSKLPKNIQDKKVVLCDPMIGTGGSLYITVKHLKEKGVKEEDITVISLIGCFQGIEKVCVNFPKIKVIVGIIDAELLNSSKYLAPGLGDFGDRYFGTF